MVLEITVSTLIILLLVTMMMGLVIGVLLTRPIVR